MEEFNDEPSVKTKPKRDQYITFSVRKLLMIIVFVLLPVLGFWGGTAYQKDHTPKAAAQTPGQFSSASGDRSGHEGGMARRDGGIGQVTAVSSTSITINKRISSTSKTYSITSATTVTNNGQSASVSDIKTGDNVLIKPEKSDTSQAASIEINPTPSGRGTDDTPTMNQ